MARALRGRDIVCVASSAWRSDPWTAQHHLMTRLARENRVLFVEPPQRGRLATVGRLGAALHAPRRMDRVDVLTPPPVLAPRIVARAARRLGLDRPLVWAFTSEAEPLLDPLAPSSVIYHCAEPVPAGDEAFAARADLAIAGSPPIADRLRAVARRVLYAPNAADVAAFARALADGHTDDGIAALPRPRIVLTGSLCPREVDVALLRDLARARPRWSFVLVGRCDHPALPDEPNVHLLGPRDRAALPDVLRGADAALVPYRVTSRTGGTLPAQVYESLAAGLPVVAPPLPALAGVPEVITAPDAGAIAAALDVLLAEDDLQARRRRSGSAAGQSWESRLERIAIALADAEGPVLAP